MTTVNKLRSEIADENAEHIVEINHDTINEYDKEFTIHIVCHPEIDKNGCFSVPEGIEEYIDEFADQYTTTMNKQYVKVYMEVDDESLGVFNVEN